MMALFAVTMAVTATEVTITPSTLTWEKTGVDENGDSIEYTATYEGITLVHQKLTSTNFVSPSRYNPWRFYNNTGLIISSEATISKVVFNFSTASYAKTLTFNGEEINPVDVVSTWTGSASSVEIINTDSKQARVSSIVVTLGEAEPVTKVEKPVLSVKPGTYYGPIEVACTTATEGAKIMFSKDGGATYHEYVLPIAIGATTEIDVYATKEGFEDSEHVTAQYTITEPTPVSSIEEAVAEAANNTVVKFVKPVTCVFQYGSYTYVKDETGSTLIYGSGLPTYTNGSVIPGGFFGKMTIYNNLVEFTTEIVKNEYYTTASFAESTETVEPIKPTDVKIADITTDMMNQYIVLSNVTFDAETNTLVDGDNSIAIYDRKFCSLPETGTYDVICVVSVYKTTLQVYPIEFALAGTVGAEKINAAEADDNAPVYNLLGQPVSRDTKNQILVKNGKKFINK